MLINPNTVSLNPKRSKKSLILFIMATISNRKIKLQPRYRESSGGMQIVPWLTVSGVWLEELGFKAGDTVRITTREKLLIIEPLEGPEITEADYKAALQEVKQTLKKLAK